MTNIALDKLNPEYIFKYIIPEVWSDYEIRDGQIKMSQAIWEAIQYDSTAAIEAGTGIGKSLAYLIPAALYSLQSTKPVIIVTETKSLQEQLLKKDIPLLNKILKANVKAELAMGASNYICLRKFKNLDKNNILPDDLKLQYNSFYEWLNKTKTGIRYEYQGQLSEKTWLNIVREVDNCLAKNCPNYNDSFYFIAREKWRNSNIIITNYHLLTHHILSNYNILPNADILILDEAHNFPEIIRSTMQQSFSTNQVVNLLNNFSQTKNSVLQKIGLYEINLTNKIQKIIEDIKNKKLTEFTNQLLFELNMGLEYKKRITKPMKIDGGGLESSLEDLYKVLEEIISKLPNDNGILEIKELILIIEYYINQLKRFEAFLKELRLRKNNHLVFWCEQSPSQSLENIYKLFCEPIDAKEFIINNIAQKYKSVICTSATLTTGKNKFHYFESLIGFEPDIKLQLDSPFDFANQALLFIPKDMPDPSSKEDYYHKKLSDYIYKLANLTNGDCLVLFTSIKSLNLTQALLHHIPYPIFSQTELGAPNAMEKFLTTKNSILFGLHSFWQGIDIKGEKLRNVIITKLPFQVPTDPILVTKTEILQSQNKNPFMELQLPQACILLKQGFGRLIRSHSDYGIVSVLDTRMLTKSYGQDLIHALPSSIKILLEFQDLVLHFENLPK